MAAVKTNEQMSAYLVSQEKTIRYARNQILEGDLISGKSILDSTVRQLGQTTLESYPEEYEATRLRLVEEVEQTLEMIRQLRLSRRKSVQDNRREVPSIN